MSGVGGHTSNWDPSVVALEFIGACGLPHLAKYAFDSVEIPPRENLLVKLWKSWHPSKFIPCLLGPRRWSVFRLACSYN